MRTEGNFQAKGKRGRKMPCLGSTTFIWALYQFCLQALGKYFNWKFSILEKMHLLWADCTTPDLSRDYDHKKHSPAALLPCYTQVFSPKLSSPLTLRAKIGHTCSPEGASFWDMEVRSSSMCNPASATQLQGARQNSPSLLSWPMAKLSTMP